MSSPCGLPDARRSEALWIAAGTAPHRWLMLDFDGTLAPFAVDRRRAGLSPRIRRLLRELPGRTSTRVAIVSGRPLGELASRFAGVPALLVGEHGWCEMREDGSCRRHDLAPAARAALAVGAWRVAARLPASSLEIKAASLVAHVRGADAEERERVFRLTLAEWAPLALGGAVELRPIDGGWELRARGRDKGVAVSEILADAHPGDFAAYVGDDESDEDAFAAIARLGVGIRVGRMPRVTRARAMLPDVESVSEWLGLWSTRLDDARSGASA